MTNKAQTFTEKVKLFNTISGNTGEFDPRKFAMYIGLILEESKEMLESFNSEDWNETIGYFNDLSTRFKRGDYDDYVSSPNFNREEALDAAVDICVVSLGAGVAVGADVEGACHEVADNNLTKFSYDQETGEFIVLRDENGKVKKPPNYKSVSLGKFLK